MSRPVHPANPWISNPSAARLLIFLSKHRIPVISRVFSLILNCDFGGKITGQLFLPHPYGIVVARGVTLGNNVTIMQQVTLGGRTLDIDDMPIVEDDVYIGAGAKVLGAIRLGKGCAIGANAVVTKDVPPGATVVGANQILTKIEKNSQ